MNRVRTALALPALLVLAAPADPIVHRAETGEVRRARFAESFTWELEALTQVFGDAVVSEDTPPMSGSVERALVVRDEFTATEDGAPTAFQRVVEELELRADASIELGDRSLDYSAELTSPLVDETLLFERVDGELVVSDETSADADLLAGLAADAWLTALVPHEPVEAGDSWTVPAEDLPALLAPGGTLPLALAGLGGTWGDVMPSDVLAIALGHVGGCAQDVEGTVEVTWTGTREEGERTLAELELVLEVRLEADLEEPLVALFESAVEGSPRYDLELETYWEVTGEGRATWDLGAGRFETLESDLDAEVEIEMRWRQEMNGVEVEVGGDYEIAGDLRLEAARE